MTPWRPARLLAGWLDVIRERAARRGPAQIGAAAPLPRPPARLRDVGPDDFDEVGREFLGHFVTLGGLQRSDSVLDIGCGPGRMALPLAAYLDHRGRYVGIDVVHRAVRWCQRHISRRNPNFAFYHANIFNRRYNPRGTLPAARYRFPLPDHSFDFVFLTSVFTHMFPEDVRHYLVEIARLLRPTGRLLATFFLLEPVQQGLAASGRNQIDFRYDRGCYRLRDEAVPESAVAIDEVVVRGMHEEAGLVIREPIRFGRWSGRPAGLSFQDIVVAQPRSGVEAPPA